MGTINKETMAGGGKEFELVPEGIYQAVLCDVVDCGYIEKVFDGKSQGYKPHLQFVFQTDETREEDGKPFLVFGRREVLSFDDRANFYKTLSSILGKKRLDEMMLSPEWDTDMLIGLNCRMQIIHNESKGKMYANIGAIFPWDEKKDGPLLKVRDYERREDRDNWEQPKPSAYDGITEANRIIQAREQSAENANAAADAAYKPTPAYPHAEYSAPNPPTSSGPGMEVPAPMTPEQTGKLMQQGALIFGAASITEIEKLAQKTFKKSWPQMSSEECSRLMHELRDVKPAAAVVAKVAATPSEVEMSAPYSPFADEGEPGFRPENHPDAVNDGDAQGELVGAAPAAYPAN